jgi:hypothetical protein
MAPEIQQRGDLEIGEEPEMLGPWDAAMTDRGLCPLGAHVLPRGSSACDCSPGSGSEGIVDDCEHQRIISSRWHVPSCPPVRIEITYSDLFHNME